MIDFSALGFSHEAVAVALTFWGSIFLFFAYWFSYWQRRGLEYLQPSFPFGNTTKLFTQKFSFAEQFADFYNQFRAKGLKHGGIYMFARPFYIPVDTEIIKNILIKDFQHFYDRGFFVDEKTDPLSGHLFNLEGTKWKNLRAKLTQTFTSGKMRMMFDTMCVTAQELTNQMEEMSATKEPVDIKDVIARFTTDVIGSCVFGLQINSLKNPDDEFKYYGDRSFQNNTWESIKILTQLVFPTSVLQLVKFRTTKVDIEEFMLNIVQKTVDYRETNNVYRKDFLHLLLQLKNRGELSDDCNVIDKNNKKQGVLTMDELAAQVFVFYLAGFETSSTAVTFALYELAKNEDMQNKLREEIFNVCQKHDNELSYDAIKEMTYLDKVFKETLRKYPSLPVLNRICRMNYHVPGTDIILEKGTMLVVPILGLHHNPDFYPNPDIFNPERFNDENKKTRPAVSYIPFGDGPRNCIAYRFGLMQSKVAIITTIKNFKIKINSKTIEPIEFDKKTSLVLGSKNKIYLDLIKVPQN